MKVSAAFRELLEPILPYAKDRVMQLAFKEAMRKWLSIYQQAGTTALGGLSWFNFNEKTTLQERFKVDLQVILQGNNQPALLIPAFNPVMAITEKAGTTAVRLHMMAACAGLKGRKPYDSFYTFREIANHHDLVAEETLLLPLHVRAASLILVVAGMDYISYTNGTKYIVTARAFKPCAIVGGFVG